MSTSEITVQEHPAQPAAVVRTELPVEEIPAFLGGAFGEVIGALSAGGLSPAGPPFARYRPVDGGFAVEAGVPSSGVVAPSGRVVATTLPGGPVATTLYRGDYGGVGAAYDAVTAWMGEHGWTPTGAPWEAYLDGPEVPEPRTVLSFPVQRA